MKEILMMTMGLILFYACSPDDQPNPDCDTAVCAVDETPYEFKDIPRYINVRSILERIPEDNPVTQAKVRLGKKLFYDPLLSSDYTVSCASCHHPDKAFSDPRPVSIGVHVRTGMRNAPGLMNLYYGKSFFWDGTAKTLEEQALIPIEADFEMDNTVEEVLRRIGADTTYQRMFCQAFGAGPCAENLAMAIASFERILVSFNAPYDQFVINNNPSAISQSARRGLFVFVDERASCDHCHVPSPAIFTDEGFHDNGLEFLHNDIGRALETGNHEDRLKFKTPSLRNLAFTAPYMHDGRFKTLEEVIEHYLSGGENRLTQSNLVPPEDGPNLLTAQEKVDLKNFLLSLSDSSFVTNPEFLP